MISSRLQRILVSALLAAAIIAVYASVTGYDFINMDDAEYVKENGNINEGISWAGIKWAFSNPVAGNWHPVTMLSHMADSQIYGLYAGGHHLTNVLWHIVNALLLFWILLAITERPSETPRGGADVSSNLWPCALVAALFGLHPLHVESVAWVSERKDVLSAFFFMLTLWAYLNYTKKRDILETRSRVRAQSGIVATTPLRGAPDRLTQNRRWGMGSGSWYVAALVFFALGLMSKPMVVTLPFVLLLLDYWPLERLAERKASVADDAGVTARGRRTFVSLFLEKVPFMVLAAIFCVITFVVQKGAGAVVALEHFPFPARMANAMVSYARYLGKTFWPDSLAMLYPARDWTAGQVAGASILIAGITLMAIWAARRRRYVFVGWFLFVGMLVPVIGLVQVGQQAMADHFSYLPLLGVFIVLAWGLAEFSTNLGRRTIAGLGAAVLVIALAGMSVMQVRHWKNSETLFEHSLRVTGSNSMAHYLLGALYDSQGKTEQAVAHFAGAVRDNPGNVKARCGLGYIFCVQGKFDEAAAQYEAVLHFEPDSAKANFGLAEVKMRQRRPEEAMQHYFAALQSNPNIAEAHYQLAALFSSRRDTSSAISHLAEAVRLEPEWTLALNNLAWILATQPEAKLRNGSEATRLAARAVSLTRRSNPNTLDTLAAAYAETGRFSDAVEIAESAIQKAEASGHTNLVAEIESHLKFYQSQRAYRE